MSQSLTHIACLCLLGFVPKAQFIFAKNCSQVWAEALNDFTLWHGGRGSQELPKEPKGDKDQDQEPEPEPELAAEEESELKQEVEQVMAKVGGEGGRWERGALLPCVRA